MSVTQLRQHFKKQTEKQIGQAVPLLVIGENAVILMTNDQSWKINFNQDNEGRTLIPTPTIHERLDLLASAVETCLSRLRRHPPESMYILINNHPDLSSAAFCHAFLTQVADIFRLYVAQSRQQGLHVIFSEKTLAEGAVLGWVLKHVVASQMRKLLSHFDETNEQTRLLPEFDLRKTA